MTQRKDSPPEAMTEGKHGDAQAEHEAAEHAHKSDGSRERELAGLRQRTAAAEEEAQRLRRWSLLAVYPVK